MVSSDGGLPRLLRPHERRSHRRRRRTRQQAALGAVASGPSPAAPSRARKQGLLCCRGQGSRRRAATGEEASANGALPRRRRVSLDAAMGDAAGALGAIAGLRSSAGGCTGPWHR
jgi:hypothetical protein